MPDRRELVLKRLEELMAETYINAKTVVRNRNLTKQDDRPAIAILDGDERARLTNDGLGRGNTGRQRLGPQLMTMYPQVFFLPPSQRPQNDDAAFGGQIGTQVNHYRDLIVRVIAQDPQLLSIVGSNGSIAFIGMETDLKSGQVLDGQARLDFAFTYPYDPSEPIS